MKATRASEPNADDGVISIREFNQNVSASLARAAECGPYPYLTVTRGHAREPYVNVVDAELFEQLRQLAGEQGEQLLAARAANPGTQLEVFAVAS